MIESGQEGLGGVGLVDWLGPDHACQSKEDRHYLCANFGKILSGEVSSN